MVQDGNGQTGIIKNDADESKRLLAFSGSNLLPTENVTKDIELYYNSMFVQ